MLVGRVLERRALAAVVAAARAGQGEALLLTGPAGIGKSTLLAEAEVLAGGLRVLRAVGSASESEVAFGGLLQLALGHLASIPEPQAQALSSALALRPGGSVDRFAIGAATLSLLSRFAESGPAAVLVDDGQLLDRPSAQALAFAARRLGADPVVVLVAVTDGYPTPLREAGLAERAVAGLSWDEADALIRSLGLGMAAATVTSLHRVSEGNPLALLELAGDRAALDAVLGASDAAVLPVPASLARAFARRADRLSPDARTALLVAAAGNGETAVVADACRRLDVEVTALDEAQDAGLVRLDATEITFRHGLVRSAVYRDAPAGERRRVHAALAGVLEADQPDRCAWHLGEATLEPDEAVARALERSAGRARERSAYAVATRGYERAAALSVASGRQVARLVEAAESAWLAGQGEQALLVLDRVATLSPEVHQSARVSALRGAFAARAGSGPQARDVLLAAGRRHADDDPDAAILLLADAVTVCFFLLDLRAARAAAERIDALLERAVDGRARWVGDLAAGVVGVLTGDGGPDRIRAALQRVEASGPVERDPRNAPWLVLGLLFLRESATGRVLVRAVVDDVRRRSAVSALPYLLFQVSRDQATTDRWEQAEAGYSEGAEIAREAGQSADLTACLAGLAWLEARQGREHRCREHAEAARLGAAAGGLRLFRAWSLYAIGELELGLGRAQPALTALTELTHLLHEQGVADVDLVPGPEMVDALVQLGRVQEAKETARQYLKMASSKAQPWAMARAARACLATCEEDVLDQHAARALDLHRHTPDSFELGRTYLTYGARLRRTRRRVDARAPLQEALAVFESLGAVPWADRAAGELDATGVPAQRAGQSAASALTPQERQVAHLLSEGRTTRETAAALFLSPKTVEYHLRHVYQKLGIATRVELVAQIRDDELEPAQRRRPPRRARR